MTYETVMNAIAIVGVAPLVLCLLFAMGANVEIGEETLVWKAAIIVWGMVAMPFIFATGWLVGVALAYWSVILGLYLSGAMFM